MHECPWPSCEYEGREEEHLEQHLDAKHGGDSPPGRPAAPSRERQTGALSSSVSLLLVGVAVLVGSYQRVQMGTLDMLQKFDPYEHFHLARYWFNEGEYMVRDALLFPARSGQHPGVGYPPLTHFEPAALTRILNSIGYDASLVEVMAFLPVVLMALTTVAMYFLGREVYDAKVGVIAALLTATFPPFIEVGRAGAYDTNLYLFLFTTLTLALFARSLNQTVRRDRLYWGALAGISLGLYALHWRGYVMFAGFLGLGIILYTGIASITDKLEPDTTYSFIGILAAVPIMSFWYLPMHHVRDIYAVTAVGLLGLLPIIAYRFSDFVEERFGIRNGRNVRHYVSAVALITAALTVYYAVQFGRLPGGLSVPGIGMFDTSGSYLTTIAELQSAFEGGNPLKRSFGMLGELVLPVAGLPVLFVGYKIWRDFHPRRFLELTFVMLTFLMMFEAARFLEPYVAVVTLTLGGMFGWALDAAGIEELGETVEAIPFARVTAVAVVLVFLSTSAMPIVAANGNLGRSMPAVYWESNGAWVSTYGHMAQSPEFDGSTAVMSWWDYGFPAKALAEVQYVSDNTQVNIDVPAKFYVMQNLTEGRLYLTEELKRERGEDVEYVVGNKYLAFGKWHAVVTVASVETEMDTPNLFDDKREQGEEQWIMSNRGVGSEAGKSNYYRLSFYNASRYGVGDEPFPGYTIAYQSPQWYIETDEGLRVAMKGRIDEAGYPGSRVVGPAITIYELEK